MKEYKTIKIDKTVLDSTECDLCGKSTNDGDDWASATNSYESETVEINYKFSHDYGYGDGGYSETISIDLCPKCFKEELCPWFESKGVKVTLKEHNY